MRGPLRHGRCRPEPPGITPAYAGTTNFGISAKDAFKDHPRVCGDHHGVNGIVDGYSGSPPRMRGPPSAPGGLPEPVRITPAYAGTTSSPRRIRREIRDHPRVCGDHLGITSLASIPWGSPPRMRGPLEEPEAVQESIRITPAYAGTTATSTADGRMAKDHPRVCGDHPVSRVRTR